MSWIEAIDRNKQKIINQWFQIVVETYPDETAKFLKSQKNPFLNPVGAAIREGLEGILSWIISGGQSGELTPFLDRIIRIRAIQEFKPSDALKFIADLRWIVRDVCSGEKEFTSIVDNINAFVDRLLMESFDVFAKCREDLYEVRLREVKDRTFRLLQRAGIG
jgi:predicted ABC-class ATPase